MTAFSVPSNNRVPYMARQKPAPEPPLTNSVPLCQTSSEEEATRRFLETEKIDSHLLIEVTMTVYDVISRFSRPSDATGRRVESDGPDFRFLARISFHRIVKLGAGTSGCRTQTSGIL